MSDVNVYLIGAGVIAQLHAAATAKLPVKANLHLTDPSREAVAGFLEKFPKTRAFDTLEAMLAQPEPRQRYRFVNATPPFAHCKPTIAALESGRHVLCEKPLAMNRDEAVRMLNAAKKQDRMLGCCSGRFLDLAAAREAKRMIDSGEIGTPYHITWINRRQRSRSGVEYQPQSRWFLDPKKSGGGVLMDWGTYDFAALIELLEPARMDVLSAWMATPKTGADPADIQLTTEQHVSASLNLHRRDGKVIPVTYERAACTQGHETNVIEVEGDRGAVSWDWLGGGKVRHSRDVDGKVETMTSDHPDAGDLGPHDKPLVFFHRHLTGADSPAIVNEQALFNFSCLRALYDAATTGKPQSVLLSR